MDSLSRRIEKLEERIGSGETISKFEQLMSYMHQVFQAIEHGRPLPVKVYDQAVRGWAMELIDKSDQRIERGEVLDLATLSWLLPAYHDEETRKLLPARVRDSIKNFLELSREGRLRIIEDGSLGGTLQIVGDPS